MKPLSAFHSRIQPFLVGCPEPTIDQALVDAAIRFCEDSKVIHERGEPFSTRDGQSGYEVDAPAQQRVTSVVEVFCDGQYLRPAVGDNLPPVSAQGGKPTHYFGSRVGGEFLLQFYPTPDKAYQIIVDAAFTPVRGATELDDDLFDLWVEAMVAGTIARCAALPNQPYSDASGAASAGMAFARLSGMARREAGRTRIQGSDRIRPRTFV